MLLGKGHGCFFHHGFGCGGVLLGVALLIGVGPMIELVLDFGGREWIGAAGAAADDDVANSATVGTSQNV